MGYSIRLEISLSPTDSNRLLGRHWASKHKLYKAIKEEIFKQSLGRLPPSPLTNFQISIIRYSPKFLDFDNLITSFKPAIDGLRLAKIIKDDKWPMITSIETDQVKSKEKKLVIGVRELKKVIGVAA